MSKLRQNNAKLLCTLSFPSPDLLTEDRKNSTRRRLPSATTTVVVVISFFLCTHENSTRGIKLFARKDCCSESGRKEEKKRKKILSPTRLFLFFFFFFRQQLPKSRKNAKNIWKTTAHLHLQKAKFVQPTLSKKVCVISEKKTFLLFFLVITGRTYSHRLTDQEYAVHTTKQQPAT